jgi:hypothetical protein
MDACARYANGHLFQLYEERTPLLDAIAKALGGVAPEDLKAFDTFSERTKKVTHFAAEKNCLIYVDAEQTYIQAAIESFGQQLTHRLNQGEAAIIMNGYQCYLKRMEYVIPMEIFSAK